MMMNPLVLGGALALSALISAQPPLAPAPPSVAAVQPRPAPGSKTIIKLATLVPSGSVWDKAFQLMGSEWQEDTAGRVQLRIYPSGSVGDEPDIVRKMRIGQINAASLTISGLGAIDAAFKVFQIPMYYQSEEEALYVAQQMAPVLKRRLAEKGFIFLNWAPAGWIHLFSTEPVSAPDDLRQLKQFLWSGDPEAIRWWQDNGFQPVPLAATDIPMGLSTGLIEAVPAPPLSALAFQWFRSTPYMMDLGAVPYMGATVMTKKAWNAISVEDQAKLLAACQRAEQSIARQVPEQETQAIEEMQRRGLTVVSSAGNGPAWKSLADRFATKMVAAAIPRDIFEQAEGLRDDYRAEQGDHGEQH